jgi:phage head maturation protease
MTTRQIQRWRKSNKSSYLYVPFEVKEKDDDERTFEGALSTSHLDLGNGWVRDIVHPGAFKRWAKTLGGRTPAYVPLLDSHDRFSIMSVYGHLLEAEERKTGEVLTYELEGGKKLEVEEMFLDTKWQVIDGVDGDRVLARLRPGSVRKMSMGYEPVRHDFGRLADSTQVRHLREVKVEEGSLVVFAMQPNAEVNTETVKALVEFANEKGLDPEVRLELASLYPELGALLIAPDGDPDQDPDDDADEPKGESDSETEPKGGSTEPDQKGITPEDPRRLEMEAILRGLTIGSLT